LPYFKRLGLNCPRSFPCFTGLWRLDDTNNLPNDTAEGLVGVELRTNGSEALQALEKNRSRSVTILLRAHGTHILIEVFDRLAEYGSGILGPVGANGKLVDRSATNRCPAKSAVPR
jgi:hypothetical protein